MRVKLIVAYDGTRYHGWQLQPNNVTIESVLNQALSELLGEEIFVTGASRTDAGVHSRGNVYYTIKVCEKYKNASQSPGKHFRIKMAEG